MKDDKQFAKSYWKKPVFGVASRKNTNLHDCSINQAPLKGFQKAGIGHKYAYKAHLDRIYGFMQNRGDYTEEYTRRKVGEILEKVDVVNSFAMVKPFH